jgi:hypothetical protein
MISCNRRNKKMAKDPISLQREMRENLQKKKAPQPTQDEDWSEETATIDESEAEESPTQMPKKKQPLKSSSQDSDSNEDEQTEKEHSAEEIEQAQQREIMQLNNLGYYHFRQLILMDAMLQEMQKLNKNMINLGKAIEDIHLGSDDSEDDDEDDEDDA